MIALVRSLIVSAALAHSVNAATMDAVAGCESGYNPFATAGPNRGLYQISDYGKAAEFRSRGYDNPYDPAQSANYFAEKLAERDVSAWSCVRIVGWRFQ